MANTLLSAVINDSKRVNPNSSKDNPTLLEEAKYADDMYIRNVLVGEAVGEGKEGMKAVFHVMRNQSTFFNKNLEHIINTKYAAAKRKDLVDFVSKQPKNLVNSAGEIIKNPGDDITGGALHFENLEEYGMPKYAKEEGGIIPLAKIGNHTFFVTLREYKILSKNKKLPIGLENKLIKE